MKKSWVMILCAALVAGALVFAGCSLRTASDEPEVRSNGEAIQWKRSSESEWHDLVSLADLKGAAGENGQNGLDGKNGAEELIAKILQDPTLLKSLSQMPKQDDSAKGSEE